MFTAHVVILREAKDLCIVFAAPNPYALHMRRRVLVPRISGTRD